MVSHGISCFSMGFTGNKVRESIMAAVVGKSPVAGKCVHQQPRDMAAMISYPTKRALECFLLHLHNVMVN